MYKCIFIESIMLVSLCFEWELFFLKIQSYNFLTEIIFWIILDAYGCRRIKFTLRLKSLSAVTLCQYVKRKWHQNGRRHRQDGYRWHLLSRCYWLLLCYIDTFIWRFLFHPVLAICVCGKQKGQRTCNVTLSRIHEIIFVVEKQ